MLTHPREINGKSYWQEQGSNSDLPHPDEEFCEISSKFIVVSIHLSPKMESTSVTLKWHHQPGLSDACTVHLLPWYMPGN